MRALSRVEMPQWSLRPGGHLVVVADLFRLGGVLDHRTERRDEVAEYVVAGAVPSRAPGARVARLAQPADAVHDSVEIAHLEGDVVERGNVRIYVGDGMVRAVAAQEPHRSEEQ